MSDLTSKTLGALAHKIGMALLDLGYEEEVLSHADAWRADCLERDGLRLGVATMTVNNNGLRKRLEHEMTRLREAICECAPRAADDVPLDNLPSHHDFSCPYRTGAPGGLLDASLPPSESGTA